MPHQDMLPVMYKKLRWLQQYRNDKHRWNLLKLFYPERWQGYGFELQKILELVSVGTLSGCAFLALHELTHRISSIRLIAKEYKKMQLIAFCLGVIFLIVSCLAIGRPNLLNLRRLTLHTYAMHAAPDCCSPAILYPVTTARLLVDHLNQTVCHSNFPLDMAIARYLKETKTRGFIVEPNLVKHIGLVSTMKGVSKYPWEFI